MTPAEADVAAARGAQALDAAVLDGRCPAGWPGRVRAAIRDGRLDMDDGGPIEHADEQCGCVLTHAVGSYWAAIERFTGIPRDAEDDTVDDWATEHGFLALDYDLDGVLAAAWARLLGAEVPA